MKLFSKLFILLCLAWLGACANTPPATPAPTVDVAAVQTQAAATTIAQITISAPKVTATPEPSATAQATATLTVVDTATPTATFTFTPTPTATQTPQPTDTATLAPTPRPTRVPVTPTAAAAFIFQWKNPFYECQRVNKPWTDLKGNAFAGERSFQITIIVKNISADKTVDPPWNPTRWIITNGKDTRTDTYMWQWVSRKTGAFEQPALAPNVVAEWTFLSFPLHQDEWVDHVEWDLFGRTYKSDNFGPGEFGNNFNFKFCPQE